jgi:ATP-dependent Clp protease ATP-binding subunit ClpX
LHCDFCRRDADEVERLIEGPNLYICNECVQLCVAILEHDPEG